MISFTLFFIITIISFLCCLTIVKTKKFHIHLTGDSISGPQKIHVEAIPRVGGIGIFITLIISSFLFNDLFILMELLSILIIISLPVVLIGLAEDLYKDISILIRLLTSIIVGIISFYYFEVSVSKTNLSFIDQYLSFFELIPFLTIFFFAGSINSINLIDGVNGLAGVTTVIILLTLSKLAYMNDDYSNYYFSYLVIASILGFLLINWFTGSIFLGDAGAYLLGVILAFITCQILLKNSLSFFNILTLFAYPIWEITNSIIRRLYSNKKIISADNKHLHSLIYILVKNRFKKQKYFIKNCLPTIFLLPLILIGPVSSLFFYQKPQLLVFSFLLIYIFTSLFYINLYNKLKK